MLIVGDFGSDKLSKQTSRVHGPWEVENTGAIIVRLLGIQPSKASFDCFDCPMVVGCAAGSSHARLPFALSIAVAFSRMARSNCVVV